MAGKSIGLSSLLRHMNEAPIVKFTPRSNEDMGEIVKGWLASDRAVAKKGAGGGIRSLKEDTSPSDNGIHPWEEKTPYVPIKRVLQQVEAPADPARTFRVEPTPAKAPPQAPTPPMVAQPAGRVFNLRPRSVEKEFGVLGRRHGPIQRPPQAFTEGAMQGPTFQPEKNRGVGFGGMNSMLGGALVGGGVSYLGSTPENRNFGTFLKGAAFGAAGGAVVSAVGSRGMMSASSGYAHGVSKKLGFGEGFTENIVDAAQKMESAQHRGVLFASGAMLAGGMFGTNRNRAQGLNSTRGNRFGG